MSAHASRRADRLVPALLLLLALVPSMAGVARVARLVAGEPVTAANARFVAAPLPVVLHLLAAVPFAILGALQFSAGLRRRRPGWHRASGRILVPLGAMVAASGLWMTLTYPWPEHDGLAVYLMRLTVGTAMLGSVVLGVLAIRRRDFATHGAWMTRAYALAMGAGTQVLTHAPWFLLVGPLTETSRAVLMGAGWAINVVVAEVLIRSGGQVRAPAGVLRPGYLVNAPGVEATSNSTISPSLRPQASRNPTGAMIWTR